MIERLDGLHNDRYYTESFQGSLKKFKQVAPEVHYVLEQAMGEIFVARHGMEKGHSLLDGAHHQVEEMVKSTTSAALLRDKDSHGLAGFSYAFSAPLEGIDEFPWYKEERISLRMSFDEYKRLQRKTAEVGWVAILEEHRGQGGWTIMMNSLEQRLHNQGVENHTRMVRTDNGYAQKVKARYGKNIVYERPHNFEHWLGEQMYFRAKLK